ncbi:helix-turn-helix domain-containing protein [Rhodoplanes serenus]|uniref:Helix-turn-helix domain-containing protein n=1 Tax=Rhodoplanes serenus TaxID=200615 RepID=A0A9X4XR36_9BRAD|nr:helix-turn-helix domain-containing protein [Rhodoplanes serenus]
MNRTEAARIGGMNRQTLRDWVHRFNSQGPDGLLDIPSQGPSSRLTAVQLAELAQIVEIGPDPAVHGVVRWRRVDLKRLIAERLGGRVSRADDRQDPRRARLLPHQRAAAPSGAGRRDDRSIQKKLRDDAERSSRRRRRAQAGRDLVPDAMSENREDNPRGSSKAKESPTWNPSHPLNSISI